MLRKAGLWWPWHGSDLPWCPKCFSMHRGSKIEFLKIYTWWALVTLTLFWPLMTPKMHYPCIVVKKRLFKILHWMIFGDLDQILTAHDAQNAFSVHRNSKIVFLKICSWWPYVTLNWLWPPIMPKNGFSMHRSSKIDLLKNCTWWPLVTLTWFWPLMMPKMRFLCIAAQK